MRRTISIEPSEPIEPAEPISNIFIYTFIHVYTEELWLKRRKA